MAEPHRTYDQQQDVESHAPYLKVWVALLVLTVLEYAFASYLRVGFTTLALSLMALALVKAALVAWYFMHLKFEGRWVYLMLVPAGILAAVLVLALFPDIGMQPGPADASEITSVSALMEPGSSVAL